MSDYKINIVHLYPDLLNLYGDKGNIECMKKRLVWRNIDVDVKACTIENPDINFEETDIFFLGGGTNREQKMVCESLKEKREELLNFIENGGTFVATCGGFEMIGKYYYAEDEKVEGLGLLDICSEKIGKNDRVAGNIVVKSETYGNIVGFENHSGRMDIGKYEPFGKVLVGSGNDKMSGFEGVVYKNLVGTYLHGPLLPKNPRVCDGILHKALIRKYDNFDGFSTLDDELESKASRFMLEKLL